LYQSYGDGISDKETDTLVGLTPINEKRPEFSVFTHLYPDRLQDEEKFTNYFRTGFESFKKFTRLVCKSVMRKQNTNYNQATGIKDRVPICRNQQ
jgi:hypothetical protein